MAFQAMIRWLLPKEDHFYGFLEEQAQFARKGAEALARLAEGDEPTAVADAVQVHEHEGDRVVHAMEEALAKTFVTPIDREDLQRLSQQLDDVLDMINLSARYFAIYRVEKLTEPMAKLVALIVTAATKLDQSLPNLRAHDYAALMDSSRSLRKLEKEGDAIFREGLVALFDDPDIDARQLLKQKEVLEDLEHALDRCEAVANTLANLSVKHG